MPDPNPKTEPGRSRRREPRTPQDLKPLIMGNLDLIDRVVGKLELDSVKGGNILEVVDALSAADRSGRNKIFRDLYRAMYRVGKLHPDRFGRDQRIWDDILTSLAQEIGPGVAKFLASQEDRRLPAPEPAARPAEPPAAKTPERDPRLNPRQWQPGLRIQFKGSGSSFASQALGYPQGSSVEVLGVDPEAEEVYLAPGPDLMASVDSVTFKFSHLEGIVALPETEALIARGEFKLEPGQSTVIKVGEEVIAEASRGKGDDYALKITGQPKVVIIFGSANFQQALDRLLAGRQAKSAPESEPAPVVAEYEDEEDKPTPPPSSARRGRLIY